MQEQREPKPEGAAPDPGWPIEVATVVDPLLTDVWALAWSAQPDAGASFATLLRMAYLQGYQDALQEEERGSLFRRLGVAVPVPTAERQPARRKRRPRGSSGNSDR